jgi:hypothetical protein
VCCVEHADDEGLQLASRQFTASDGLLKSIVVKMGLLELEASFDSLAWAGTPYTPKQDSSPLLIHAQIVGAMVREGIAATPAVSSGLLTALLSEGCCVVLCSHVNMPTLDRCRCSGHLPAAAYGS